MKKFTLFLISIVVLGLFAWIGNYLYIRYQRDDKEPVHQEVHDPVQPIQGPLKRAVVCFSAKGDQAKHFNQIIQAIHPDEVIVLRPGQPIRLPKGDYAYILFTGDHGNIAHGRPTQFNGMAIQDFKEALKKSKFTAQLLILDTCFGASMIPLFVKNHVLRQGSQVIAPLGEGQGFTAGIIASYKGAPMPSTFVRLLNALDKLGSQYNALSIYEHREDGGVLYSRRYKNLSQALQSARFLGIQDQKEEILAMIHYLRSHGVRIKKMTKKQLIKLFEAKLKDTKW